MEEDGVGSVVRNEAVDGDGGGDGVQEELKIVDNIAHLSSEEDHKRFLEDNPEKLVVMKFFAPWCRACKGLEPKYKRVANAGDAKDVVFAQFDVQHNKKFVKSLGILALPNVHFYSGGESSKVLESFPCGPSKVPILKKKLGEYIVNNIDADGKVIARADEVADPNESAPCAERDTIISKEQEEQIRNIVYFADMPDEDFKKLLSKATLSSFEPGSTIMKQGFEGAKFYVIRDGEVEVKARTGAEDPMSTGPGYEGVVVNRLNAGNFFGERSLITGEPRAATIKAVKSAETTRCFTFKQDEIPASCVLSGKRRADISKDVFRRVDDKYGAGGSAEEARDGAAADMASSASQVRGSVNTLGVVDGVDNNLVGEINADGATLDAISVIPLLQKFKMVRTAARCFDHIMRTTPKWGDPNELYRRSLLVGQLTEAQKTEFKAVFDIIDSGDEKDGEITLLDLKRTMESVGQVREDEELAVMINKANPAIDGNVSLSFDEFMGMIAEAEFYNLFVDTFNALDKQNSGFIRAGDLRVVLEQMGGVAMGSDERTSIVKVADDDMLIDYDYFSRMLIGA